MAEEKQLKISEEFKAKIRKKFPDRPGRIYGVTSGKGGVGKTSFSAMLSYGVAAQGYATLIIDLDTGLRNLDIIMGVDAYIVHNLYDVLERGEDFANAVLKAPGPKDADGKTIDPDKLPWVCVSIQEKIKNAIGYEHLSSLLEQLRDVFDVIILDGPAGIEYGSKLVTLCADEYFIVCTPNNASIRGADQINKMQIALVGEERPAQVVVNMYIPEMVASDGALSPDDISSFLQLPIALTLPMDISVNYCGHNGLSVWHMKDSAIKPILKDYVEKKFPQEIPDPETLDENNISTNPKDADGSNPDNANTADSTTAGSDAAVNNYLKSLKQQKQEQQGKAAKSKNDEQSAETKPAETKEEEPKKKGFLGKLFSIFGK